MDIPQKIDKIIAARKKQLPKIEASMERTAAAKSLIERLDRFRSASAQDGGVGAMMQANQEFAEKLESISTDKFYDKYMRTEQLLKDLYKRFERDEVHISFVGRAGQGKSLVLQKISGLPGSIIPSADGSDCTGAKSVISNSPGAETKAEITFYSESEYFAIINKYLETIFKTATYNVFSMEGVVSLAQRFPELAKQVPYTQAVETSLLNHLEKYVRHAGELRELLGRHVMVPEAEIESYIAQYQCGDTSHKYFRYLGVKEARILASFPCAQCGKIVLEDTIGIGATSLGVEDAMLETVRQDSDAIIYMLRPDPCRPRLTKDDYTTISKISDEVGPEYARQMLFWLINRVEEGKGQNSGQIPEIMEQLSKQDLPVAQCLNVNCWRQDEVETELLLPVLNQMSAHLAEIDAFLIRRTNEQLAELENEFKKISSRIEGSLRFSINRNIQHEFEQKYFTPTTQHMTNEVRELYRRYGMECGQPCTLLEDRAEIKLKNTLLCVPKTDEIITMLNDGMIHTFDILETLAEKIRVHIINDFLDLNPTLHEMVLEMKRSVVHLLAAEDIGRLGFVVEETDDPEQWLDAMMERLEDNPEFQRIYGALKALRAFDLRMENFLIYKVRICLTPLDWSMRGEIPTIKTIKDNPMSPDKPQLAEEVRAVLKDIVKSVHDDIRAELESHYVFPNEALFAVVRDFFDRITNAGEAHSNMEREWRYLYEGLIPVMWPEEYRSYQKDQYAHEEWNDFTAGVRACAEERYFFIK
ncbi:MAG: hypothetical protein K2O18_12185 [Oscillospiraceae bacterium]|nr:hypothetical protein [Oscillospiraceae bacterium]